MRQRGGWFTAWVAQTGENRSFVAFMAHGFFAAFVVSQLCRFLPIPGVIVVAVIAAGAKEFWFDLHYETLPPQTILDSARDFAGYAAGTVLGVLVTVWR